MSKSEPNARTNSPSPALGFWAKVARNLRAYLCEGAKVGFITAAILTVDRRITAWGRRNGCRRVGIVRLSRYPYPFKFRYCTSDSHVLKQIFADEEYSVPIDNKHPRLIIDCGANIGCCSAYLLNKYPDAHVIAVEPDSANIKLCRENLRPFGCRADLVRAAVWPTNADLKIELSADGLEWGYRVRPCLSGEAVDIQGISIEALIARSPHPRVDLLKIDIEGAEGALFAEGYEGWIGLVDNIVIELHGPECSTTFFRALSNFTFEVINQGELTIAKNIRPTTAPA